MVQILVLVGVLVAQAAVLAAQIYAIVRSEQLLSRERKLHEKFETFLSGLTPAGLWPQYESLKKFNDEQAIKLNTLEEKLAQSLETLERTQTEVQLLSDQNAVLVSENETFASLNRRFLNEMDEAKNAIQSLQFDVQEQIVVLEGVKRIPAHIAAGLPPHLRPSVVDPTFMNEAERAKQQEREVRFQRDILTRRRKTTGFSGVPGDGQRANEKPKSEPES